MHTLRAWGASIESIWIFRTALAFHIIVMFGLGSDFAWHMRYWGEDMYKIAHLVLWTGMLGMVAMLVWLRARGESIPTHVFFMFPMWLVLYITTDDLFDTYFEINSSTFWTPFRLTFGPIVIYYLYWLYRTGLETNAVLRTYLKTFLFFILPARFVLFVFVPFAPFSSHIDLHGSLSILVSVGAVFAVGTMYKICDDADVLLPGMLLLSAMKNPAAQFFIDKSNMYNTQGALWVLFGLLGAFLALRVTSRVSYAVLAWVVVTMIYFLQYMGHELVSWPGYVLSCCAAVIFTHMYYEIEVHVVPRARRMVRRLYLEGDQTYTQ